MMKSLMHAFVAIVSAFVMIITLITGMAIIFRYLSQELVADYDQHGLLWYKEMGVGLMILVLSFCSFVIAIINFKKSDISDS